MTTTKSRSITDHSPVADGQATAQDHSNLVVLRGKLVNEPIHRELPSGSVVVQFDISTPVHDGSRTTSTSAPIAWLDPSDTESSVLVAGGEYLVVGHVARRFFRVGGATQSRTEVVAASVTPVRRRKQVDAALADVVGRLVGR